jgi:PAS domain S-box-containing protein
VSPNDDPKNQLDPSRDAARAQLRRRAEHEARVLESEETDADWPVKSRRVLHELRVHQIELEVQNEELRSAREQLESSRARYFDLYDLAPVGYLTLSDDGLIVEANLTSASLLGVPRTALRGRRLSLFVLSEDDGAYYLLLKNLSKTRTPQACELRMTRQGDAPFWARLDGALSGDSGGAPGWRIVISDITAHKEWEEQLRAQGEELRRANHDLEQFAYSASHDLQEPLRSVKIYSELLDKRYHDKLDGEALQFLGYVRQGASSMEALLRDLLIYTQATQIDKPAQPTDATGPLRTALESLAGAIFESGAKVTFDSLPSVPVHSTHLQQIFQNLIGNAIKYRRSGVAPRVHIAAQRQNGEWQLSVSDNGIGIESEYKQRIFSLFKRLHAGTEYSGTGIGLSLCQRIVERYGGHIWVESEPGNGSTFFFTLPV